MSGWDPLTKAGVIGLSVALALGVFAAGFGIFVLRDPGAAVASREEPNLFEQLLTRSDSPGESWSKEVQVDEQNNTASVQPRPQSRPETQSDPQSDDPQSESSQAAGLQSGDAQSESSQAAGQPGDPQPGDAQSESSQAAGLPGDPQPGDPQPGDPQPGDPQSGDSQQPGDPQQSGPQAGPQSESSQAGGPQAGPQADSQSAATPLPVEVPDWPEPDEGEVAEVNEERDYGDLPSGAILGLTIDALGVSNAPVWGSDTQEYLDRGVVHVPETSLPWTEAPQRNTFLAAHRIGYPGTESRLLFYDLDQLQNGDRILLEDPEGETYEYEVSEMFVVDPYDSWVMGQVADRDMVTLQTCTPIPTFEDRLIVRADRV